MISQALCPPVSQAQALAGCSTQSHLSLAHKPPQLWPLPMLLGSGLHRATWPPLPWGPSPKQVGPREDPGSVLAPMRQEE